MSPGHSFLNCVHDPIKCREINYCLRPVSFFQINYSFYFFKLINFNWRLIALQYCGGFAIHWYKSAMGVQFSSVGQSCPTLYNPMDSSTPGLPVHHQLPEFTQTHVHWVGDAIQPSYPLSSPSPAFSLSQHQDLFRWVSSLHQVAKVLEFQL